MTAKELLEHIVILRKAIDYRNTKIVSLTEQAENISARLTGMPHNPSGNHSMMETAICRRIDLEREVAKLEAERKGLIAKIDQLEDSDLSRILLLRYVQEVRWEEIAVEMGYSRAHVFRLNHAAIESLDNLLKDETK